jgi:hypothetical protein
VEVYLIEIIFDGARLLSDDPWSPWAESCVNAPLKSALQALKAAHAERSWPLIVKL